MKFRNIPYIMALCLAGTSFLSPHAKADLSGSKSGDNRMYNEKTISLTPIQEYVTKHDGTEPAFDNAYWNNKEPGIYVDVATGEPLFSSLDKFDSGTGWPSFTKPIGTNSVKEKDDYKLFLPRTEVRSSSGDNHLGHVFNDGPSEKGGMRYCINSASLKFIHKDDLEKEGYSDYLTLFK